jgi:arylsulfatase A-like enzyme
MRPSLSLAIIVAVSELSLLILRGYPVGLGLLFASLVSFLFYLTFFLLLQTPFLLFQRKARKKLRSFAPPSLALSMAILTFAALGLSSKFAAGASYRYLVPLLISAGTGIACFVLISLFSNQRLARWRVFSVLLLLVFSFLWRMEVDPVSLAEKAPAPSPSSHARIEGKSNLVLIVIDTLRSDRLGCYGNGDSLTPTIDALREDGILFRNAIVPCPRTTQSVSSLMTGLYPSEHGVRRIFDRLDGEARTLAEVLRDSGYETYAIVSNPVLRRATSGLSQGFHHYDDAFLPTPFNQELPLRLFETYIHRIRLRNLDATSTTDRAIDCLREREKGRPFFLWIQYFDPHWIYLPPPEYRDLEPQQIQEITDIYEEFDKRRLTMGTLMYRYSYTESLLASFRQLYDGEVRYCDAEIGRFLSFLKSEGLYETSLIVFTADHGEGLGEHDYYFDHGLHLFEDEVRVPLLVKPPSTLSFELDEFTDQVTNIDFLQNSLYIIGLESRPEARENHWFTLSNGTLVRGERSEFIFGESDTPLILDEAPAERKRGRLRMIRSERYKLVFNPSLSDDAKLTLYDLEADPAELTNIYAESLPEAQNLRERLKEWYVQSKESERERSEDIDRLLMEDLKALGYFQ